MLCLAATHKSIYGKHCSRYLIQQISLSGLVVCYRSSAEGAALAESAGCDVFSGCIGVWSVVMMVMWAGQFEIW